MCEGKKWAHTIPYSHSPTSRSKLSLERLCGLEFKYRRLPGSGRVVGEGASADLGQHGLSRLRAHTLHRGPRKSQSLHATAGRLCIRCKADFLTLRRTQGGRPSARWTVELPASREACWRTPACKWRSSELAAPPARVSDFVVAARVEIGQAHGTRVRIRVFRLRIAFLPLPPVLRTPRGRGC